MPTCLPRFLYPPLSPIHTNNREAVQGMTWGSRQFYKRPIKFLVVFFRRTAQARKMQRFPAIKKSDESAQVLRCFWRVLCTVYIAHNWGLASISPRDFASCLSPVVQVRLIGILGVAAGLALASYQLPTGQYTWSLSSFVSRSPGQR